MTWRRAGTLLAVVSAAALIGTLIYVESTCCGSSEASFRDSYFRLLRSGLPINLLPFLQGASPSDFDRASAGALAWGAVTFVLLFTFVLAALRRLGPSLLLVAGPVASLLSAAALKAIIVRPPPLDSYGGHSLPSGHAAVATATAFCLGYAAWRSPAPHALRVALVAVIGMALAIGLLSTITLHYPTDALAGAAVGGIWSGVVVGFAGGSFGR